jgi:hypothetical protein
MVAHVAIKRHPCNFFKLSTAKKIGKKLKWPPPDVVSAGYPRYSRQNQIAKAVSSTANGLGQHLQMNMLLSSRISRQIHARISAMNFPTSRILLKKGTELVRDP